MPNPNLSIGVLGASPQAQTWVHVLLQAGAAVRWYLDPTTGVSPVEGAQPAGLTLVFDLAPLAGCALLIDADQAPVTERVQRWNALEGLVGTDTLLAAWPDQGLLGTLTAPLAARARWVGLRLSASPHTVAEVIAGWHSDAVACARTAALLRELQIPAVRTTDGVGGGLLDLLEQAVASEALQTVTERVADAATVDRILQDQLGWPMGPFQRLNQLGLDVGQAAMEHRYRQQQDEARLRPSTWLAPRAAASAGDSAQSVWAEEAPTPTVEHLPPVWVPTRAARRGELYQLLKNLGAHIETAQQPSERALIVVAPLGHDVTTVAAVERLDATRTVGIDMLMPDGVTRRRVLATNPATRPDMRDAAHALFARDGKAVSVVRDSGGFVAQRAVAALVNLASELCQRGVCTPEHLDTAVTQGMGYPHGPLSLADQLGPTNVLEILFNLQTVYGDMRYRPSPWLRRRGALGLSLTHQDS